MTTEYTFWACWVKGSSNPTIQHRTLQEAQVEATRLARLPGNVGKPVFILTAGSFAVVEPQPCIIRLTTGIDPNAVEDVPL